MFANVIDSINDTLNKEAEAIMEVKNNLDEEQVSAVFDSIKNCKGKIITTGCGTSGAAAKKIAHTLSCVGSPALFLSPSDAVHGALGVIQKGDIVIALSKGGATKEINNMIPGCKEKGATLIGITESNDSYLALEADYLLNIRVTNEPDDFNMLATSSTLTTIALFDALSIALTRFRGYSKEQFAVIHPGGKVGEILTNKK